jgi:hypothetical protein
MRLVWFTSQRPEGIDGVQRIFQFLVGTESGAWKPMKREDFTINIW